MIETESVLKLRSLSSVVRWTVLGTLVCIIVSIGFNIVLFGEDDGWVMARILLSATLLPTVLGGPLFFYFSMRLRDLAIDNVRLGRVARTDSLTACLNRGAFATRVETWLDERHAEQRGALLMIDADNFKSINDRHGHQAGDEALTIIARAIRSVMRAGDIVGRMGGEELAVFLPNVSEMQARMVAERIRLAVNQAGFTPNGVLRPLSVSVGGAVFSAPTSFPDLFRIADQRLYGAKQAGRNAVAVVHVGSQQAARRRSA